MNCFEYHHINMKAYGSIEQMYHKGSRCRILPMCLKWKYADIQTCTTNILIKVEKLIKYYRQWLKEYELIHLHRDLSLSMIEVYYTLPYTDRQTTQILFCCGDLNTIKYKFRFFTWCTISCYLHIMCPSSWGTHVATYIHVPPRPSAHSTHTHTIRQSGN